MIRKFLAMAVFIGISGVSLAAELQPRLITVTGEGEVFVVPDQVQVNLQVESFDASLAQAKKMNDEAVKKVLAIVKNYKVDAKDFQTDFFTVRQEERYYMDPQTNLQRSKKGFYVSKNVAIKLKDVSKFEDLYSDALNAGVNNIYGVTFKSAAYEQQLEKARALAIANAKDKAVKMAGGLQQEVGRPYTIQENYQQDGGYPRPMMLMAKADMAGGSANNETIALGQIRITASVTVSFELK